MCNLIEFWPDLLLLKPIGNITFELHLIPTYYEKKVLELAIYQISQLNWLITEESDLFFFSVFIPFVSGTSFY